LWQTACNLEGLERTARVLAVIGASAFSSFSGNDAASPHPVRAGLLTPVYHGESGVRTLRELSRSYLAASKDLTRVMNRLKVLYRSWAIPCAGQEVYSHRALAITVLQIARAGHARTL
jgi:hypothetical protein